MRAPTGSGDTRPLPIQQARARAINLPWHFAAIVAVSNLAVVVDVYYGMTHCGEPVYAHFTQHLVVAVSIAALITITIAFFLIEQLVQALVFPALFRDAAPYRTERAFALSLPLRALLMAVAGAVGPITMLLLIGWADDASRGTMNGFRIAVGALGMFFGFAGAWLFTGQVMTPIRRLARASQAVARGDLETHVDMLRADEFGSLADEFNHMVAELRDKQRLRETFGLHVGEAAAQQILSRDPGLGGSEREISVMFCDIRGFTAFSAGRPPAEVLRSLNEFLGRMVDIVEKRHGGMINKYLGDGFMALFGAAGTDSAHALHAVEAAREILGTPGLFRIGIGIHTGPAIVGNIGSESRLEYTAIGDTVNLASRVEGMTKLLETPLLFTRATARRLPAHIAVIARGAQAIRGVETPVELLTLAN
jgi:adenylate cyclase